jgi:hypothetical protein
VLLENGECDCSAEALEKLIWNLVLVVDILNIFYLKCKIQSAYQKKIPARNAIYAHAQDFAAREELLLAILKSCIPQPVNEQDNRLSSVLINSV